MAWAPMPPSLFLIMLRCLFLIMLRCWSGWGLRTGSAKSLESFCELRLIP